MNDEIKFESKRDESGMLLRFKATNYAENEASNFLDNLKKTDLYLATKLVFGEKNLNEFIKKTFFEDTKKYFLKSYIANFDNRKNNTKNLFKRKVDEPYLTKILNKINDNKNIIFTENKSKVFFIKLKFKIKIFYYFLLKIISPKFILNKNENIKIGVSFVEGINKYKRSDLFWHDKNKLSHDNIIVYFENSYFKHRYDNKFKGEIENNLIQNGYKTVDNWKFKKIYNVKKFSTLKEKLKINYKNPNEKYLAFILEIFLLRIEFWYSFFLHYEIRIDFSQFELGNDQIAKKIALELLNGCVVKKVRSYVGHSDAEMLHAYDDHVVFVWGEDLAKRLIRNNYKPNTIIISGFYSNPIKIKDDKFLSFINNKKKKLLILDNIYSDNNEKDIDSGVYQVFSYEDYYQFYKRILNLLNSNLDLTIIIKPKKNIFYNHIKLQNDLKKSQHSDRIYIFEDFEQLPVFEISKNVDFIATTGIFMPSALMECLCINKDKTCIHYDYSNLKTIEKEIYQNIGEKFIFNDLDKFSNEIQNLLNKKSIDNGSWKFMSDSIDNFNDFHGHVRIQEYLVDLRNNLLKKDFINSINLANDRYKQIWGDDKVVIPKYKSV